MASITALLLTYVLGGVTFLPLVFVTVLAHFYFTQPKGPHATVTPLEPTILADEKNKELEDKLSQRTHEPDVAAGYFAVCREYVPGGVNGKPPERTTPAGETITAESPSVYQTMYRTIFDRGKTQSPTIEAGKPVKKARNVFFVVLRHGHLVLFDNSEQLEVRHVISLAHHNVDVFAGGDTIPEGELWIKRNCIRLTKKAALEEHGKGSMPFYLFSDNCSEKEDFYHALLHNQNQQGEDRSEAPPEALLFKTEDMIKLIRNLHVSEENTQSRWLNAFIGRLFLALYQTSEIETVVRNKISKKIARVAKPAFITSLRLEDVLMGDSAPFFSNPKLREMTVDGALTFEADVRYTGNFKAVIAAVARIDLGSRFKARDINMILAGVLKRLEGHMLIKIKPPPSNRIWFTFETMPKLDISLEPIVSSRQITYNVILRTMISRIREVFGETLVVPNWDDIPFTSTLAHAVRGGIWKDHKIDHVDLSATPPAAEGLIDHMDADGHGEPATSSLSVDGNSHRSSSMPVPVGSASASPPSSPTLDASRKLDGDDQSLLSSSPPAEKPKAMRSHSFASAASPIVSKSPATTEGMRRSAKKGRRDAASSMKTLSNISPDSSPIASPMKPSREHTEHSRTASTSSTPSLQELSDDSHKNINVAFSSSHDAESNMSTVLGHRFRAASISEPSPVRSSTTSSDASTASATSTLSKYANSERAKAINQSINSATSAAKTWSWGVLNRQNDRGSQIPKLQDKPSLTQPMGRGQPLPPPGVPLPKPEKNAWTSSALGTLRRKPVAGGNSSRTPISSTTSSSTDALVAAQVAGANTTHEQHGKDDVLAVGVPHDSAPSTPRDIAPGVHEVAEEGLSSTPPSMSLDGEGTSSEVQLARELIMETT